MKEIKSDDYHDYVIKDGKFIGAFEETVEDMLSLIKLEVIEMIEINRLRNHGAIVLFKRGLGWTKV